MMKDKKFYWICIASLLIIIAMVVGIRSCSKDDSVVIEFETAATTEETSMPNLPTETSVPNLVTEETEAETTEAPSIETAPTETEETTSDTEATTSATEPEVPTPTYDIGTPPLASEEPTVPATTEDTIIEVDDIVYATGNVNIRTGPSTDYEKIGVLEYGVSVQRTGISGDWSRIMWEGHSCFVHSSYVSTDKPEPVFDSYPIYYNDGATNITISKEWFCNTWCYAAHVELSDYSRMSTRCANGAYENGYQTTTGAANAANAILAVNGDYSAPYLDYIVVRNGKIWNGASRSMWMPGVYSAYTGQLLSAWETGGTPGIAGANVQALVDAGTVTDTFCFGPPILQGGSVLVGGDSRAQRTFIGTNGNAGDIWIVVSDGRYNDGASVGLTAGECAEFLASKDCSFGIPLDGGGSSTMVFNGQVLNGARGNQRSVVDFLVITH